MMRNGFGVGKGGWLLATLALMMLLGGLLSLPAGAATFIVTTNSDSGAGSLRQAVFDANSATGADTVTFQAGLTGPILLTSGKIPITGDLTIQGPGAANLTVDGNRLGGGTWNIFEISVGVTATIDGLTLQNGYTTTWGGAINSEGILTVSNSKISSNVAEYGGGGIANQGTLTVINTEISGNRANNTNGNDGGGGINNGGVAIVKSSRIINNIAVGDGGGISIWSDTLNLNWVGQLKLIESTVSGNSASMGGGIASWKGTSPSLSTSVEIINSTLSGNNSTHGGGVASDTPLTFSSSTVAYNTAANLGGGLYIQGSVAIGNTLVAGNSATTGPEIWVDGSNFISQGYNLFGVNGVPGISGTYTAGTGDLTPTVAITAIIGALADNGGPTQTHLPIAGTSPAINAGDDALIPVGITTDQRGYSRIQGTPLTVDIGAVESGSNYPLTVILAGTGSGSVSDEVLFNCPGACTANFASATSVTLTATANGVSTFIGWSGSGCSGTGTCTVTMNAAQFVTATFDLIGTYAVTYNGNGSTGGTVPTDGSSPYLPGNTVTVLGAGTLVKTGATFADWNTAANGSGTSYAPGATFTMGSSNIILYAQWTLIPTYTVTATAGPGGVISPATRTVNQGATTTFTVASPGYTPTMGGTCPLGGRYGHF